MRSIEEIENYLDDDLEMQVDEEENDTFFEEIMQKIDDKVEYDKLKQIVREKNREAKIKLKINKLDEIAEASWRLEESNAFTSVKQNGTKYLVNLIEDAWIRHKNRIKAKHIRKMIAQLPFKWRISYVKLLNIHRANKKIANKKKPKPSCSFYN